MSLAKYITRTVKPTLLAAKQHLGAYADGDVLFDWTEFNLPNGTSRLVGVTAIVRGNDGAAQDCPMDLMFATKTPAGSAPQSTGTEQGAMLPTANPYYNEIIGGVKLASIITLDGTSALLNLAPGDVVRAQDEAVMGTINTVDSATQITLTAANTAAIADGDLVYRLSPITLKLTFERT